VVIPLFITGEVGVLVVQSHTPCCRTCVPSRVRRKTGFNGRQPRTGRLSRNFLQDEPTGTRLRNRAHPKGWGFRPLHRRVRQLSRLLSVRRASRRNRPSSRSFIATSKLPVRTPPLRLPTNWGCSRLHAWGLLQVRPACLGAKLASKKRWFCSPENSGAAPQHGAPSSGTTLLYGITWPCQCGTCLATWPAAVRCR